MLDEASGQASQQLEGRQSDFIVHAWIDRQVIDVVHLKDDGMCIGSHGKVKLGEILFLGHGAKRFLQGGGIICSTTHICKFS